MSEPPPDPKPPTLALVGRPNSGKSSMYNRLTGGDAHVGNFPGITVDILEDFVDVPGVGRTCVLDVPGLYTFEASVDASTDEGIARDFLLGLESSGERHVIAQVADSTQLGLALRLTRELVQRGAPLVLLASQADVLAREGRALDVEALSRAVGIPVVAVSARDPGARARVFETVAAALQSREASASRPPATWEPDELARRVLRVRDDAGEKARAQRERSARIDRVVLHPVLGPVLFLTLMTAIFAAVFLIADPVTTATDGLVHALGAWVSARVGGGLLASFLSDGVLGGAGTVIAFLPQIVVLTLAMELLEASGYLARGAFLVDRLLRAAGLGGRAFVPLLTAHACAVPAIAATRILRDPRERALTIAVLPLMTCSARIPVYSLLITTFFHGASALTKALIFVGLYFFGITAGLLATVVIRRTMVRGRGLPLLLEMPAWRMPEWSAVARAGWKTAVRFVKDVGTVILAVSVVLWALLTIPRPGAPAAHPDEPAAVAVARRSVAAGVGQALEPVTRPAGFDWRINVGLIGSFGAREVMVGTMGVIFGVEDADDDPAPLAAKIRDARRRDGAPVYTRATGLALMAFFALACQCMSTVAAIRRETRSWRWPLFVLVYTYALGYVAAVGVYQLARALGW